jgi:hypothetical protein
MYETIIIYIFYKNFYKFWHVRLLNECITSKLPTDFTKK